MHVEFIWKQTTKPNAEDVTHCIVVQTQLDILSYHEHCTQSTSNYEYIKLK